MTDTPLIRAARALAKSQSGVDEWDALDEGFQATLIENVRAVLEALKPPSAAMMAAAAETPGMKAIANLAMQTQVRGYNPPADAFGDGSPMEQAWRAAIDTALSE